MIDLSTTLRFGEVRHLLNPRGAFIRADGFKNASDFLTWFAGGRRVKALVVSKGNRRTLTRIASWLADGTLRTIVDSGFAFSDYRAAFERLSNAMIRIDEATGQVPSDRLLADMGKLWTSSRKPA